MFLYFLGDVNINSSSSSSSSSGSTVFALSCTPRAFKYKLKCKLKFKYKFKTNFMKTLATLFFILFTTLSYAQHDYEPSAENPFGLRNPDAPEQLDDFKPLIGECACTSERKNPDGTWAEPIAMTWTFKYIMNGTAIQDETIKADGIHSGSIRQFNADSLKWYVHYYTSASATPSLSSWEGAKKEDGKIVLYKPQKAPNGMDGFSRLTFYDISKSGYQWIGEWVDPSETVVFPFWRISCTKPEN